MGCNYVPVAFLRETGCIQEINRLILHPLGMALQINVHDDGAESFGLVQDERADKEGMVYLALDQGKLARFRRLQEERYAARVAGLGYFIQEE